ncbi:hypothetical protein [Methanobacterium alcaliphilum]|uniref:hypothetical protein n=1 Tax=Methanobacterium alcaliphilum TaxID=392018 RepID=UPI00200B5B22|nr:hypothetical protein [Methanobacterium alcaliphilum]MCK9151864.1 hypothetical protein [Methanobacterium alcaliphilum]
MERNDFINRRLIFAILLVFVFLFGLQIAEPVSAAKIKLISKGQAKGDHGIKLSWKTYRIGYNYVKIKGILKADQTIYTTLVLKKIGKTKLKVIEKIGKNKYRVHYTKTKHSAVQYYWNQRKKGNYLLMWHD